MNILSAHLRFFSMLLLIACSSWAIADNHARSLPVENSRHFVDIIEKIHKHYVKETTDDQLFKSAIRGMISSLDPHSSYLTKKESKELNIRTRGEFGGLGIHINMSDDGFVRIISPIDDTPAAAAGLLSQDLIISLDGAPVKGLSLDEVLDVMRGRPGTKITLTVLRESSPQPFDVTITRAVIKLPSVRTETLSSGYGYVRVSVFQGSTGPDLVQGIEKLRQKNDLKGLVLDLRNNPGGLLSAAIEVSDTFLAKDELVVFTEGRIEGSNQQFKTKTIDLTGGVPIVVLINGGSASASEIVAGALQDHKRAAIMGTHSFGKGSVQTIIQLGNGDAVKLTTALYFTPNGRSIQAEGIQPDIFVAPATINRQENDKQVKEADLRDHLANANGDKEKEPKSEKGNEAVNTLLQDYQITEAFNLLKGLNIYRSN